MTFALPLPWSFNPFRFGKKTKFPQRIKLEGEKDIVNIFEQNQAWKESMLAQNPEYFKELGSKHTPQYMWIGCSDARVPPQVLMGEDAGKVFVVRNIANLVVNTDFSTLSALMYGVEFLNVPHIIVCGHYNCGGVRASETKYNHGPPLENWIRNIRDVYRLHQSELDSIRDPEARHRRLVELNVIEQCINLFKTGVVQKARLQSYEDGSMFATPRIHPLVFDPSTGVLKPLKVDFEDYIEEIGEIYDLYPALDERIAVELSLQIK